MTDCNILKNKSDYTIYESAGCNPSPHCADWGDNGLIVFGAHHSVAVLDPNHNGSAKIIGTYIGHESRVNTVHWLRLSPSAPETYFISGSDDCYAYIWQFDRLCEGDHFEPLQHKSPVTNMSSIYLSSNKWLIATAAEQIVSLWTFNTLGVELIQAVCNINSYVFGLKVSRLPSSEQLLLAYGNEKGNVVIWAQNNPLKSKSTDPDPFRMVHNLTGHEDWVRALDFIDDGDDLLLASAAQDNFIRLWRISKRTEEQTGENHDICNTMGKDETEVRVEEKIVHLSAGNWCAITLESVLYGHEGWVYGVNWHKSNEYGIRLLSISIDKSIIIWALTDNVWMEQVRVGEVGGNSLGFYGGKFSSDGKSIFGHSYQGGFHIWHQSSDNENVWTPGVIVGGHFDKVRDLAWAPNGEYLLSVSADQTTRIHAPWRRSNDEKIEDVTWHELARPQVHGYDMQALAILSRYKFASGAEEKIVRTFQASANFIENFRRITRTQNDGDTDGDTLQENLPTGASVPSLGLSNKAVFDADIESAVQVKHTKDEYPENYFVPVTLDAPPQEETLMQNTLWPEMQKLYGHGFEIYALAASPDGKVLASACRATNETHAKIILWDTTTWKQIQKLAAHKLTVTQMRFSPNGRLLLSVSRDRTWALFERNEEFISTNSQPHYRLKTRSTAKTSAHTRIIWDCDWSHDGKYFLTGGRDGVLAVWAKAIGETDEWSVSLKQTYMNPVMSVAFAPDFVTVGVYQLAVGFLNGDILLQQLQELNIAEEGKQLQVIDATKLMLEKAHDSGVNRLQFQPLGNSTDRTSDVFLLASCGDDYFVRIFKCTKQKRPK